MLKALEVIFRLCRCGRSAAAPAPAQTRSTHAADRSASACFKIAIALSNLLHLLVADALKIDTSPHPADRASPPAESWPAQLQTRCPHAAPGPGCTRPAHCLGIERDARLQPVFASSSFCRVSSAMPSLMAACASLGSFLNASANALRRTLGKLLAHLRHAAIVQPHCLGVEARLRCGLRHRPKKNKTQ